MFEGLTDEAKRIMILDGLVPESCTLQPDLAMLLLATEVMAGRSPCWGCNQDREECGGFAKQQPPYPDEIPKTQREHTPASMMALKKFAETGDASHLRDAMAATTRGGVEAQEKQGQSDLVNSTNLPKDMQGYRHVFEQMGIEFGEEVDDLMIEADLPEGWKKVRTDHHMWSEVQDEQGRKRVRVFYKAAFYDKKAHMSPVRRLSIQPDYDAEKREERPCIAWEVVDHDDTVLYRLESEEIPPRGDETREQTRQFYAKKDQVKEGVVDWLNEQYPEWESPLAYWDADIEPVTFS